MAVLVQVNKFLQEWRYVIVAVLLASFVFQCFLAMQEMSITYDEKRHLPNGYLFLQTGTAMNIATPALAPAWAALPFLFTNAALPDPGFSQMEFTDAFFFSGENNFHQLIFLGRSMMVLLGMLLGLLIFSWARQLYGVNGGLLALLLYSFNPTLLGYTPLVMIDLALTLMIFVTVYAAWKFLQQPALFWLITTGILFGIAQAVKYPAVFLAPILLILWSILYFRNRELQIPFLSIKQRAGQFALSLLTIFVIGWITLNLVYGFQGTFTPFSQSVAQDPYLDHERYSFDQGISLVFPQLPLSQQSLLQKIADTMPLLFPYHYTINFLYQMKVSNDPFENFLAGRVFPGGRWDYYLVTFLIKEPIAILLLLLFALFAISYTKEIGNAKWFLLIPALFYFLFFSLSGRQVSLRYILPIFPFLFVFLGSIPTVKFPKKWSKQVSISVLVCCVWYVVAAGIAAPYYFSYVNEAFGQENAYQYLVFGNIDLGQDLIGLKEYLDRHQVENISLSYFGDYDPAYYGVVYEHYCPSGRLKASPHRTEPRPGLYAVSVSNLQLLERDCLGWLKQYEPETSIGYSILIYNITEVAS